MPARRPAPPDVLADGICGRGRHAISSVEQTISYRRMPGRYCRACAEEMAAEVDDVLIPHRDPSALDELAIEFVIEGVRNDKVWLTRAEVEVATLRMTNKGMLPGEIADRLKVSPETVYRIKRRISVRASA